MIYGINFGGQPIPDNIKRRFAERLRWGGDILAKPRWMRLQGATDSEYQLNTMLINVNNGHRVFQAEERVIKGTKWYGLYAS